MLGRIRRSGTIWSGFLLRALRKNGVMAVFLIKFRVDRWLIHNNNGFMSDSKTAPGSVGMFILGFLLYAGAFFAASRVFPPFMDDLEGWSGLHYFDAYARYAGAAFGFLSLLLMLILLGLAALFGLRQFRATGPVIFMLGFLPWAALGCELVYREPRYAMVARAIISYGGKPMFYAGAALMGAGLLWLIVRLIKKSA